MDAAAANGTARTAVDQETSRSPRAVIRDSATNVTKAPGAHDPCSVLNQPAVGTADLGLGGLGPLPAANGGARTRTHKTPCGSSRSGLHHRQAPAVARR